jgi:sugar/nucleoside kinase (ribokinase family)
MKDRFDVPRRRPVRGTAVECLCAGSLIVDLRMSAAPRPSRKQLSLLAESPRWAFGGVSIVARTLAGLGRRVGAAGCVGRDPAGTGLREMMRETGIDTRYVSCISAPTGFSMIVVTPLQRRVTHAIGANAFLARKGNLAQALEALRPRVFLLAYLGLLPDMESRGAAAMTDALRRARRVGAVTMVDIHTCPLVRAYLPAILPETDLFFCNQEEAALLSGRRRSDGETLLRSLWTLAGKPSKTRLFGLTDARAASLLWWHPGTAAQPQHMTVPNQWFGTVHAQDLTGAGDAFRAGMIDRVLAIPFPWDRATMNRVVRAAHTAAAHMIRGPNVPVERR